MSKARRLLPLLALVVAVAPATAAARLVDGCCAPPASPAPAATPEPTPTPKPDPEASPPPPPSMRITRGPLTARTVNRAGEFRIAVRVDGGAVRDVLARLLDRRGRVYARTRVAHLDADARLILERTRRLRPGRHVVRVGGRDSHDRPVRASARVPVRRAAAPPPGRGPARPGA